MQFSVLNRGGAILLAAAIGLAGCDRQPLTIDKLIERHVQAVGGRAALEAIHSIRFDLHIADPGFEVDGAYVAARPGWMRIDITANGQRVYTEALHVTRGWQWKGKGEPKPNQRGRRRRCVMALNYPVTFSDYTSCGSAVIGSSLSVARRSRGQNIMSCASPFRTVSPRRSILIQLHG